MKINTLEISGFGPFKNRQVIDFDSFDSDGLFLINGKTGSGKSSILDAICFALYGQIPRYEGSGYVVRSHHCEPGDKSVVTLEFTVLGTKYRLTRSPEYQRPKARGEGFTTEKAAAGISSWDGQEWVGLASGNREVGAKVLEVVKLSQSQFLQVVLLAQNKFHEFLFADSLTRQKLLRTLFHTVRFDRYADALRDRKSALGHQLQDFDTQSETIIAGLMIQHEALNTQAAEATDAGEDDAPAPDFSQPAEQEALLTQANQQLALSEQRAQALGSELAKAVAALDTARSQQAAFERRSAALSLQAELRQGAEAATAQKQLLDQLERLAPLIPLISQQKAAAAQAQKLHSDALAAQHEWQRTPILGDYEHSDPTRAATWLDEALTLTRAHEQLDTVLPQLQQQVDELALKSAQLIEEIAGKQQELQELPQKLQQSRTQLDELQKVSLGLTALEAEAAKIQAQVKLAGKLPELQAAHQRELATWQETQVAHSTALKKVEELYAERIAGFAFELAQDLEEGEPCAVCGSTEHPAPASTQANLVSAEEIQQAEAAREAAGQASALAANAAQAASQELSQARGALGEVPVAELTRMEEEVTQKLAGARMATEQLAQHRQVHQVLEASEHNLNQTVHQLKLDQGLLEQKGQDLRQKLAEKQQQQLQYRQGFESIALRIRALEQARSILARANTLLERSQRASAHEAALTQNVQQAFHDANLEAGSKAEELITQLNQREELRELVRDYEQKSLEVAQTLADPQVEQAPTSPIEVAAFEAAVSTAQTIRDQALTTAERARGIHTQITTELARLETVSKKSQALRVEYERCAELADYVNGAVAGTLKVKLESYVLSAELEEIVKAANVRLHSMSSGRYELVQSDSHLGRARRGGLAVEVLDVFTSRTRPTHSLSGGESFLASMALALGLAEVVSARAGGITLDTLFIDEGFGSLDSETLHQALAVLDELRAGGRTVGVISHVEAMKEQIPAQINVAATPGGWSTIDLGA